MNPPAILVHLYQEHASITYAAGAWSWTCQVCGDTGNVRSEYQACLGFRRHKCAGGKANA